MTKQDWTKQLDYDYTGSLESAGWAWEFLRRSKRYNAVYTNGDQSKAIMFNLKKLYSPDDLFHSGIEFQYVNIHPIFFGSPGGDWDFLGIEQLANFTEIHPLEELPNRLKKYSDTILIAFDTAYPLKQQLAKARDLLVRYQKGRPFISKLETKARKEALQINLRVLDAISSGNELSQSEIIEIIHPDKKWPSISADSNGGKKKKKDAGYDQATPQQIASYASDVFQQAQYMSDEGYQNFLIRLSQGI